MEKILRRLIREGLFGAGAFALSRVRKYEPGLEIVGNSEHKDGFHAGNRKIINAQDISSEIEWDKKPDTELRYTPITKEQKSALTKPTKTPLERSRIRTDRSASGMPDLRTIMAQEKEFRRFVPEYVVPAKNDNEFIMELLKLKIKPNTILENDNNDIIVHMRYIGDHRSKTHAFTPQGWSENERQINDLVSEINDKFDMNYYIDNVRLKEDNEIITLKIGKVAHPSGKKVVYNQYWDFEKMKKEQQKLFDQMRDLL